MNGRNVTRTRQGQRLLTLQRSPSRGLSSDMHPVRSFQAAIPMQCTVLQHSAASGPVATPPPPGVKTSRIAPLHVDAIQHTPTPSLNPSACRCRPHLHMSTVRSSSTHNTHFISQHPPAQAPISEAAPAIRHPLTDCPARTPPRTLPQDQRAIMHDHKDCRRPPQPHRRTSAPFKTRNRSVLA